MSISTAKRLGNAASNSNEILQRRQVFADPMFGLTGLGIELDTCYANGDTTPTVVNVNIAGRCRISALVQTNWATRERKTLQSACIRLKNYLLINAKLDQKEYRLWLKR